MSFFKMWGLAVLGIMLILGFTTGTFLIIQGSMLSMFSGIIILCVVGLLYSGILIFLEED